MNRILLLGKNGQVGWELHRTLLPLGEVIALDSPELDFTDFNLIREQVLRVRPSVIINAVAYTAVDQAESQPEIARRVNAEAPALLAELAQSCQSALVHYSTDFVYDGMQDRPYTEDDAPNPLNTYAQSKLDGDIAIQQAGGGYLILRSSWIYSHRRDNFVKKVLSWAHTRTELSVVTDQVGSPTWARALAEATAQMLAQGIGDPWGWAQQYCGVYHLAGEGRASRYQWAEEILKLDPARTEQTIRALKPASSDDFPTPARRPLFAPLDCTRFYRTFGLRLPDWRVSLELALETG